MWAVCEFEVWSDFHIFYCGAEYTLVLDGSNKQYSSIGSDNGLAPTRRQAIIWNNDG